MSAYDYHFLTLGRAPTPHQALAERLKGAAGVVGQFAPQLGWATNEAAVLARPEAGAGLDFGGGPLVVSTTTERLTPTLRPADGAAPSPGGVHVHRWFEVDAGAVDAFVALSDQGWERFEALFDARIFGLFRAEASAHDRAENIARLLLITRYGDHGAWEASRDPTTQAMRIFARRQQLTRRSWAASTRLIA